MCTAKRVCVLGYKYMSMSLNKFEKSHEFAIMSMISWIDDGLFCVCEYLICMGDLTEAMLFSTTEIQIKHAITFWFYIFWEENSNNHHRSF